MYIDHRSKSSGNAKTGLARLSGAGSGSERNSPSGSGPSRDAGSGSSGVSSGISKFGSFGARKDTTPSGRVSGTGERTSAGQQAAAGKPSQRVGDIKSASFNGVGSSVLQQVLKQTSVKATSGRSNLPIDLGASIPRSRVVTTFRNPGATYSAGMLASSRPRTTAPVPAENEYVLDDMTLTYGHSSFQGARDYQEDTVACVASPAGLAGGVFDGHGGDDVSKELERVLLQNINRKIADASQRNPEDIKVIERAIHDAYTTTNDEIGSRLDAAMEAGSCAVTAVVTRVGRTPTLFCANAGDCRAVLYTVDGGVKRAVRLSEDHKPHPNVCPREITRICEAGGCVLWGRVQGCLAVSRAFGDRTLQPYVIADPHVSARPLNPEADLFFYLASDGVTDMVDDAQGCAIVAEQFAHGANTTQAAAALVSAAYQKGSCDNISVLVVRIRRRQPGDGERASNGGGPGGAGGSS